MTTEDGQRVKVADGALTQFLPVIDDTTITVKPFSDFLNLLSGGDADVVPTEWVPARNCVYPGNSMFVDHMFEMGYRDMEAWLEKHLTARLEKVAVTTVLDSVPDLPPTPSFDCPDDGMQWY